MKMAGLTIDDGSSAALGVLVSVIVITVVRFVSVIRQAKKRRGEV